MDTLQRLPTSIPDLCAVSDSIKVVEVAKKYDQPEVSCCDSSTANIRAFQTNVYRSTRLPGAVARTTALKVCTCPICVTS